MTIYKVLEGNVKYYRFIPEPDFENIPIEDNYEYSGDCALGDC